MIEQTLLAIRTKCERAIDSCSDALDEPLTATDDETDSLVARENLEHAMAAAKLLLAHLEERFEFAYGMAEPKEEQACQERT